MSACASCPSPALVKKALETLKGRARVKRTMWSRRAQEYEAKINSGDIVAIAEVVRDLYRSESQPEQSYSERQLYEAALDRLSREIAVVQHSTETEAVKEIESQLAKSPRRGAKAEGGAEGEGEAEGEADEADDATATTPPSPTRPLKASIVSVQQSKARSQDRAFFFAFLIVRSASDDLSGSSCAWPQPSHDHIVRRSAAAWQAVSLDRGFCKS